MSQVSFVISAQAFLHLHLMETPAFNPVSDNIEKPARDLKIKTKKRKHEVDNDPEVSKARARMVPDAPPIAVISDEDDTSDTRVLAHHVPSNAFTHNDDAVGPVQQICNETKASTSVLRASKHDNFMDIVNGLHIRYKTLLFGRERQCPEIIDINDPTMT